MSIDLGVIVTSAVVAAIVSGGFSVVVARMADASARSREQLARRQARIGDVYPDLAAYAHHLTDWAARTDGMPADPGPRMPLAEEQRDLTPNVDAVGSSEIRDLFRDLHDAAWLHAVDAWYYATMRQALADRMGTTGAEVIDAHGKAEASRSTLNETATQVLEQVNAELTERVAKTNRLPAEASHRD